MTWPLLGRAQDFSTTTGEMVQELLGCTWGRAIRTPDDEQPCPDQAVQIIIVHNGADEIALKLCSRHRDRVLTETTPRGST